MASGDEGSAASVDGDDVAGENGDDVVGAGGARALGDESDGYVDCESDGRADGESDDCVQDGEGDARESMEDGVSIRLLLLCRRRISRSTTATSSRHQLHNTVLVHAMMPSIHTTVVSR